MVSPGGGRPPPLYLPVTPLPVQTPIPGRQGILYSLAESTGTRWAFTENQIFLQRIRIATSALLAMPTAVIARAIMSHMSVRLSVHHVPVFCPMKDTIVRFSASGRKIILVSGEVKFIRIFSGVTPSHGAKVKHPLSLLKIWPIIGHNFETVQDRR